jgi:predicted methyltransferase
MLHEVPDSAAFAREIYASLKPDGRFLVVEPSFIPAEDFQKTLERVQSAGFLEGAGPGPKILLGRTRLFQKV